METLQLRKTRDYVGTYRHLDKWEAIGSFRRLSTHVDLGDEDDYTEPMVHKHLILVESGPSLEDIESALLDEFTAHGCAHEYDCCGCRSFHARSAVRITGGGTEPSLWEVTVASARNF